MRLWGVIGKMIVKHEGGRIYDILTGERVNPGDNIIVTGILTRSYNPQHAMRTQRELFIKEETLVWLAEKAGYALVKRDAGDSGDAEGVDAGDAESGDGEAEVREVKAGGSKAVKRSSNRKTKD
jgi:hypothetical protein